MEGRFEDYTLGRNITIERVKEIYHLFKKHQFQLAGLRSFGGYVTEEQFQEKVELAQRYRDDPELFARVQAEAAEKLKAIPIMAKGVKAANGSGRKWLLAAGGLVAVGTGWLLGRKR
ncbi:MAG: hypothetical protein KC413_01010, partial [Anaerolineales bacterium]|nr:hypothetical protein [Anaerolineales bacterium]